MRSVGVKVLKNRLSEYIRLVEGGETVLVTHRDRVVAEIVPPREGRSLRIEDVELAEAVRSGLVSPPLVVAPEPPAGKPIASLAKILSGLESDHSER